jgi:glucose/arabinose dehydrogenase
MTTTTRTTLSRSLTLLAGLLPGFAFTGEAAPADPYKDSGINPLSAVKLTAEQEAAILKDVTVAEGMDLTLFAPSQMINYPIFIAAAPDGTVFVGSDGNGAQGKAANRGRIVRLRDTDGDGRADETKLFVKNVDSPRGVVWDRDRLYVVHPPHLSAFIDQDGDGEAEKQEILVDGIGWDFKGRPADHATNGVEMGVDGYLYIAGGDFGIMKATGKDGTVIQHRAGGVIRVRTDGTGLEVFATGTRNILEVATSPLLDHFTRDNTNDGGGWDVRFHYFTGLENHGYPWLYKNFPDEHIKPLSDYGGGSGCGAVWIDEPAFKDWAGEWAGAPFTVDWGTGAVARHNVKRVGASYEEVEKPKQLVKLSKPCDADVDGMGNLYVTSWKGAVFNWAGTPEVGYVARVHPKGYVAPALLDVAKADVAALVKQLEDGSHRRRFDAQRELIRRAKAGTALPKEVQALADDVKKPLAVRVIALAALHQSAKTPPVMP